MLKTRVITALFLLAAVLPALFYLSPLAWAWCVAGLAVLAGWEWGGLMRLEQPARIGLGLFYGLLFSILVLLLPAALGGEGWGLQVAWEVGRWFYIPAVIFWLLLLPAWLWKRWPMSGTVAGVLTGAVVLLPFLLALVQLRQLGPAVLLALMAIVWVADIAAYFAGRTFGKRKLAPAISPGKTWAGAWGGVAGVVAYGLLLSFWLLPSLSPFFLVPMLVLLAALSIVGDLFESLLKRQAGIKDSSQILPGHGGVLDRIDSLTSTLPLMALFWFLWGGP